MQPIYPCRPAWDHLYFHLDPRTLGLHHDGTRRPVVRSVPNRALSGELSARGYILVNVINLSRECMLLPPDIPMSQRGIPGDPAETTSVPPARAQPPRPMQPDRPPNVPKELPKLNKKKEPPPAAMQVVGWMERGTVVDGIPYDPMYMWSKKARKAAGFKAGKDSNELTKRCEQPTGVHVQGHFWLHRCKMYLWIRAQQAQPCSIEMSYTNMRDTAAKEFALGGQLVQSDMGMRAPNNGDLYNDNSDEEDDEVPQSDDVTYWLRASRVARQALGLP